MASLLHRAAIKNDGMLISQSVTSCLTNHKNFVCHACSRTNHIGFLFIDFGGHLWVSSLRCLQRWWQVITLWVSLVCCVVFDSSLALWLTHSMHSLTHGHQFNDHCPSERPSAGRLLDHDGWLDQRVWHQTCAELADSHHVFIHWLTCEWLYGMETVQVTSLRRTLASSP